MVEEEGLGRFADGSYDDDVQEKVADTIVEHEGGLSLGAGGTGKSENIRRIKKNFEANGFWDPPNKKKRPQSKSLTIPCGFTHVAATNLAQDGTTVLYMLHKDARRKRSVFVFDEASMIGLATWGLIAQL